MEQRFAKENFLAAEAAERGALCEDLAAVLAVRLGEANEFGETVSACVEELRALGHDLWSFDESDDFQAWCPNYDNPTGPGVVVTFSVPDEVSVEWSAE